MCEDTVQGNVTRMEYYEQGTEPTEACICHVEVSYCEQSGQAAGPYCTLSGIEHKVYLVEGTDGTADAEAVIPEAEETCQMHQNWWNMLFPEGQEQGDFNEENSTEHPKPGNGRNDWWSNWF